MGVYSTRTLKRSEAEDLIRTALQSATDEQLEDVMEALIGDNTLSNFWVRPDDAAGANWSDTEALWAAARGIE